MKTALDPASTGLLIVDPQVDTLSPDGVVWDLLGGEVTRLGVVDKLVRLRAAAQGAGLPVFYSRVEVTGDDYDTWTPVNGLQALMAERRMCQTGRGSRFHPALEPGADTVLLTPRKGPSPVHSDLHVQLHRRGVQTLVVAGMIANLCVESHVREAAETGYRTVVVGDAIATTGPDVHAATLANLGLFATEVVTAREALDALAGRPTPAHA